MSCNSVRYAHRYMDYRAKSIRMTNEFILSVFTSVSVCVSPVRASRLCCPSFSLAGNQKKRKRSDLVIVLCASNRIENIVDRRSILLRLYEYISAQKRKTWMTLIKRLHPWVLRTKITMILLLKIMLGVAVTEGNCVILTVHFKMCSKLF